MKIKEIFKRIFSNKKNNENKSFSMKQFTDDEFERLKQMCSDESVSKEVLIDQIGASFTKFKDIAKSEKYLNSTWGSFVSFSVKKTNDIPYSLLEYMNRDNYRTLFEYVKNWTVLELKKKTDERCDLSGVKIICDQILENIDENDIPALLLLGQIYRSERDYEKARDCYEKVIKLPKGYNGITALADCYNDEICDLLSKNRGSERDDQILRKVSDLNKKMETLFVTQTKNLRSLIEIENNDKELKDLQVRYVSITCKYARWLKIRGFYDRCVEVLNTVPVEYEDYYRTLVEKGLLCQNMSKKGKHNRYYNLNNSTKILAYAYETIKEKPLDKNMKYARKSILIPLANSYFMSGDYDEALRICKMVLEFDSNEKNAKEMIRNIKKRSLTA